MVRLSPAQEVCPVLQLQASHPHPPQGGRGLPSPLPLGSLGWCPQAAPSQRVWAVQVSAATPSQLRPSGITHDLTTCPRKTLGRGGTLPNPQPGMEGQACQGPGPQEPAPCSGLGSFSNPGSDRPCPEHLSGLIPHRLRELLPVTVKAGRRIVSSHIPMSLVHSKGR